MYILFHTHTRAHAMTEVTPQWITLGMKEGQELYEFASSNNEIQSVHQFCHGSIFSGGSIDIRLASEVNSNSFSDVLMLPSAKQTYKKDTEGRIWSRLGSDASLVQLSFGWFACDVDQDTKGRPMPCVLNMYTIQTDYYMDSKSRRHWRFWDLTQSPKRLLPNVIVFGRPNEMPDHLGRCQSVVKRLRDNEWSVFQRKLQLTKHVESERSNPVLVSQSIEDERHKPDMLSGSADVSKKQAALSAASSDRQERLHQALVTAKNSCWPSEQYSSSGDVNATVQQKRDEFVHKRLYEMSNGRHYVPATMPEVPIDLIPSKIAYFEQVCLAYRVPMSMLSSGDATGRVKLNAASASPESARIFRDSQFELKEQWQCWITEMYHHIHHAKDAAEYITKQIKRKYDRIEAERKRMDAANTGSSAKKGIAAGDAHAGDTKRCDHLDEESTPDEIAALEPSCIEESTRVIVCITSSVSYERLIQLHEMGALSWPSFCMIASKQTNIPLGSFVHKRPRLDQEACASVHKNKNKKKKTVST